LEPNVSITPRVLIVDPCVESREVLRTVLQRRGITTVEASEGREGLALAKRYHPGVIVLDMETVPAADTATRAGYGDESRGGSTSLVMLASARRDTVGLPDGEVVPKPYHYGPLIRTIEQLLQTPARAGRRTG